MEFLSFGMILSCPSIGLTKNTIFFLLPQSTCSFTYEIKKVYSCRGQYHSLCPSVIQLKMHKSKILAQPIYPFHKKKKIAIERQFSFSYMLFEKLTRI